MFRFLRSTGEAGEEEQQQVELRHLPPEAVRSEGLRPERPRSGRPAGGPAAQHVERIRRPGPAGGGSPAAARGTSEED